MPKPFLFLLLAFALCFGQTLKNTDIDSLKEAVKALKAEQGETKKSIDSLNSKFLSDNYISIKVAKETQELHNKAFEKMQCSFNIFVVSVCGIITLFALLSIYFNFKISGNLENKLDNLNKEVEAQKRGLEETNRKVDGRADYPTSQTKLDENWQNKGYFESLGGGIK